LKTTKTTSKAESHNEVDIGRLIGSLIDGKWLISAIVIFSALLSVLYCIFATPIYQSDSLVQVEQNVGNQIMDNLNSFMPNKPASVAEIELIQSRLVLGKTIDDLGLDTVINQHYFPIFGKGWARLTSEKKNDIAVSRFTVPKVMENQGFQIEVKDEKSYTLFNSDGDVVLNGTVGERATANEISLLVSDIKAEPGTVFDVVKLPFLSVVKQVQGNLMVQDMGKDTGVLSLTYTDPDPVRVYQVLDRITKNYLLQNVERKSEEAAKSLAFLDKQIPSVRNDLDAAENKLNHYRQQNDSVDLSLEAKSMLDTMVNVESQLNQLTFKEAEISKLYTKDHPAYRTLLEQRQVLVNEKDKLNKRINTLPQTQQEILRLTRDVQSGQEVFMQLLNKQQELKISQASTVGNVRIIDNAVTLPGTVKPNKPLIVAGSILVGFVIAILVILFRAILHRGVMNPSELEEAGINVYASIPISLWQQKQDRELSKNHRKLQKAGALLAINQPADMAVEAVRSLRTSLHFAMMDAKNNVLMISGASPSTGKTFVSSNLTSLIAQAKLKVVLIDADLRKGYLHDLLGLNNAKGLSEVLSQQCTIEDSIQRYTDSNFDVITRGQVPPNPAELLMSSRLGDVVEWASKNYDIVIVDTPPILAVTDAAIIGKHAGTSLLVTRFAVNTLKEIEISINRFEQNGIEIKGVILNSVFKQAKDAYSAYGYYAYEYKSSDK